MDGSAVNEAQLNRVVQHLVDSSKGLSTMQEQLYNENEAFKSDPNFINYLILVACNPSIASSVRFMACLRIKAMLRIKQVATQLTPAASAYLRSRIVTLLDENDNGVRTTAGTLLADLASKERLAGWTQTLTEIISRLSPQNTNVQSRSGAMSALFRIWEDVTEATELDKSEGNDALASNAEANTIADMTLQACIMLIQDSVKDIRHNALRTAHIILEHFEGDFITRAIPGYLASMFAVGSSDQSSAMCVLLCEAFSTLACGYFAELRPHASSVFRFIVYCLSDASHSDDLVREKAADFVALFVKENEFVSDEEMEQRARLLEPFVPSLVPALFASTKYTPEDVYELEQQLADEDDSIAVSKSRKRGVRGGDDDDDENEEDTVAEWNRRKAAASALEQMARVFRGPFFTFLAPLLTAALMDTDWHARESALLVIGAVSFGCITSAAMKTALPEIIPFVIQSITAEQLPFLRSTALWTAACFAAYMLQSPDEKYLLPCLSAVSSAIVSSHRMVQKAAYSALATIAEEAGERMEPYLDPISRALTQATSIVRPRSYATLLDAITTVLENVGAAIAPHSAGLRSVLLPFYLARQAEDVIVTDTMYAFMALLRALAGTGADLEIVSEVFYKTMSLLDVALGIIAEDRSLDVVEDDHMANVVATSADLFSVIFEILGSGAEALLVEGSLLQRVGAMLNSTTAAVLQSAHALVGDLSRTCSASSMMEFHKAYPLAAARDMSRDEHMTSAATNACWSIGEIIAAHPANAQWMAPLVIPRMVALFLFDAADEALNTNIASTLGLFGMNAAASLAEVLGDSVIPGVAERWVYWATQCSSSLDMYRAFAGFANLAMTRPQAVFPSAIKRVLEEYPKIEDMSERVMQTIVSFIGQYKIVVGAETWSKFLGSLSQQAQRIARTM